MAGTGNTVPNNRTDTDRSGYTALSGAERSVDIQNSSLSPREKPQSLIPRVSILLCTYQGERFLAPQLDSLLAQDHSRFTVWVSDDGSDDQTLSILKSSSLGADRLHIRQGPGTGHADNFLSLVCSDDIDGDYFAYADQDDIWETDKLSRALEKLRTLPPGIPGLYCSRTRLIDDNGHTWGYSPRFRRAPGFANALVQNIGGGNTMVFNRAARKLLCAAGPQTVVGHDWWTYLLVSGAGGIVIYDEQPGVAYRSHEGNSVGANIGLRARLCRANMLLKGRYQRWHDTNLAALRNARHLLTPWNRRLLDDFAAARVGTLAHRTSMIMRSGVYRQTRIGNVGLLIAALINKL